MWQEHEQVSQRQRDWNEVESGPGSSCALHLLIWGVTQQSVYETKIHDIDDLQKTLNANMF